MDAKVTDEMLMAFVDGELDASTAAAVARAAVEDGEVAERIAMFEATRRLASDALGTILREPVPDRLVEAVRGRAAPPPAENVVAFRPRAPAAVRYLAMAASLTLAIGVGYLAGSAGTGAGDSGLIADAAVADALSQTRAGETRTVSLAGGEAALSTVGTFRVADGYCRTFRIEPASAPTAFGGVGCARGGDWTIDLAVAQPAVGAGSFQPASGAALGSIDAFLDSVEAEGPLPPAEEPTG